MKCYLGLTSTHCIHQHQTILMKPALFSILILIFLCSCSKKESAPPENKQPNILWIVGENLDLDLGVYGMKNVHTPRLDELASRGVKFTHVFSTSPVCAPSRSAFMTGMYQTTTDTHHMRSHRDDDFRLPEGVRPITHRLQEVGYVTANITHIGEKEVGTGKLDLNFVNEGELYQTGNWEEMTETGAPFFAMINLLENEYDIYDRKSAEKPRVKWVGEDEHPRIAHPDSVTPPPYYPDHEISKQEWARYLNSVSGMDVRVGWILDALKEQGLEENTIVVFFGDNGRLEARGIHWLWDTGIRVPMIISWPKNFQPPAQYKEGSTNDDLLSLLDLTATTLWMGGIEKPEGMQSQAFWGNQAEEPRPYVFSARDRIDETVIRMRSVRGKRYHYIRNYTEGAGFLSLNRYKEKCFIVKPLMRQLHEEGLLTGPPVDLMEPFPDEILYDTENDPYELTNLATSEDPAHQEALREMRSALENWIIETGDRGEIPEAPEIIAPFEKEMHDWFGTPDWYTEKD